MTGNGSYIRTGTLSSAGVTDFAKKLTVPLDTLQAAPAFDDLSFTLKRGGLVKVGASTTTNLESEGDIRLQRLRTAARHGEQDANVHCRLARVES